MEIIMSYDKNAEKEKEVFEVKAIGSFDKKSKLLLCDKAITEDLIKEIEAGNITSETLAIVAKDYVIRKYKTQITIHGDFSSYSFASGYGYKFVFKNKNNSMGVRYGAIDAEKRKYIASYLRDLGIFYRCNSSESYFYKAIPVDKAELDKKLAEARKLYANSQKADYQGKAQIYSVNCWGIVYIVFRMDINAISHKEVNTLLTAFGFDKATRDKVDTEKARIEKEEQAIRDAEKAERVLVYNENRKKYAPIMKQELFDGGYIKNIDDKIEYQKHNKEGLYFKVVVSNEGLNVYILCDAYKKSSRARKLQIATSRYHSIAEMKEAIRNGKAKTERESWDFKRDFITGVKL
jgi:hypothetical protein